MEMANGNGQYIGSRYTRNVASNTDPAPELLALISRVARLRERQRRAYDNTDAELRQLIREGFEQGIPGDKLAEAAGLSKARAFQIRDGRR